MVKHIVFIGPQGSGKGTQAVKLGEFLGVSHISTGDLFREAIEKQTRTGLQVSTLISQGILVPDELTNQIVSDAFELHKLADGYVLDGYPRTMTQAKHLASLLQPDAVIVLELDDEEAIKRISGRLICVQCKHMAHEVYFPPKVEFVCDDCGGILMQRNDDTENSVRERLRLYHAETEPIVKYYESLNLVKRIDGRPTIQQVHESIKLALEL